MSRRHRICGNAACRLICATKGPRSSRRLRVIAPGASRITLLSVDAIAWASDFPHPETTYPDTRKYIEEQFAGVPEEDVRKIVAENAARFYNLDLN
jgi:predicted TIM-barrel fold metal-dependent hydrolase